MTIRKFKFITAFIFALMFAFSGTAFARELYVRKGGNDSNNGLTWNTAFATITRAVNAANSHDRIRIAAGTYAENINTDKELLFYGSYPANGGSTQDYEKNITIIDGQEKDRVIYTSQGIYLYGLTIRNGKTDDYGGGVCYNYYYAEIQHCNFINNSAENGGAVACMNDQAGSISDCTFTNNTANDQGGAIYSVRSIKNCTFTGNKANDGAGICEAYDVTNCTFTENTATNQGGGMCNITAATNCTFTKNTANQGGGIYNSYDDVTNCTFTDNRANQGGGIYRASIVKNCVFTENKAENGGGIYNPSRYANITTIDSCTFDGNEATEDGGGARIIGSNRERIEIFNSTFTANYAKRGGGVFLEGNGDLQGKGWKRIKHCTFVDNAANQGTELYTASTSVDDVINCIFWNADGGCIANKNKALLTFTNCAMEEDELVGENLDDDDIYDTMITIDLHPIELEEFTPSHEPEKVSVSGVQHTVFKLDEDDTDLINKGIELTFTFDDTEFDKDQIGNSRNINAPTVGAVEYVDSDDDYGGGDNGQDSKDNTNNNSVSLKSSGGGCNSGLGIFAMLISSAMLIRKRSK